MVPRESVDIYKKLVLTWALKGLKTKARALPRPRTVFFVVFVTPLGPPRILWGPGIFKDVKKIQKMLGPRGRLGMEKTKKQKTKKKTV